MTQRVNGPRASRRKGRYVDPWLVAAIGAAALGLMVWTGLKVAHPYMVAYHIRRDNGELEQKILALKQQNQDLRKQTATLDTPSGMEREARRLGFVRPGEVPLVIPK